MESIIVRLLGQLGQTSGLEALRPKEEKPLIDNSMINPEQYCWAGSQTRIFRIIGLEKHDIE